MKRRHREHGRIFTTANVVLTAIFLFSLWGIGLFRFADEIPDQVTEPQTVTDAIVVLTGGSRRLGTGLDLLSRDFAERLFVSGVYQGLDVRRLLQILKRNPGELERRIGIGNAVNTAGNATETAVWVRDHEIASLRLVTAAYHMPRSLLEFRQAMAETKIIPHPVFPENVKQSRWWAWPGTASLIVSEYNKLMFAWLRHRVEELFPGESGVAAPAGEAN